MSQNCLHPIVTRTGLLFPCQKCPACLSQKKEELAQRIYMESQVSRVSYFVTLTYDDDHLPFADKEVNCFEKQAVSDYIRAIRDYLRPKKISIRYFLTSEYGDKSFRSHYHMIVFFNDFLSLQQVYVLFAKKWTKGIVYVSSVSKGCARYVSKYCLKDDGTDELPRSDPNKPFRLFSRRPGIGCTDECIKYYEDLFSLHQNYFNPDEFDFTKQGASYIPKVPRVVKNHMDPYTQQRLTAVGWSKFYSMQEGLGQNLRDGRLNRWDGCLETNPQKSVDLEIKQKTRKLRSLKKNSI